MNAGNIIIIVLTIFCAAIGRGQSSGWSAKIFDAGQLLDLSFVDNAHGWAVGTNGKIMKTTNGGTTWSTQVSPTDANLNGVDFLDLNVGYAVGNLGAFLRTTDGGTHWNLIPQPDQWPWWKVHFSSSQVGWKISKDSAGIWYTSDAGTNWTLVGAASALGLNEIWFTSETNGWIGGGSEIWHTTDGTNWTSMNSESLTLLTGISFPTDSIGYLTKAYSTGGTNISVIYKTTDAGSHWTTAGTFTNMTFQNIFFLGTGEGWTCGYAVTSNPPLLDSGCIFHSNEFADNWNREHIPDPNNYLAVLERIQFVDRGHGWAVGYSYAQSYPTPLRLIERYLGPVTAVDGHSDPRPWKFSLDQNYPNPFNPRTKIHFTLETESFVTLRIFDLFGRQVATLINERQSAGEHSVEWDALNLSSGVYYYKLQGFLWRPGPAEIITDFLQTRKMLLLK